MIAKTRIGSFKANWVLRHRWEPGAKEGMISNYEGSQIRTNWQLGIWAKRDKIVGAVKRGKNKSETVNQTFGKDNLVNDYTIGLNLIVCKVWVNFSFSPTLGMNFND